MGFRCSSDHSECQASKYVQTVAAGLSKECCCGYEQVSDAGRTEVLPGSVTVLGIAGPAETVDRVTGSLRLLQ